MRIDKEILREVTGAKRAAMPQWIEPMKAVLVDHPFSREGWIFEDKYDGIRAICYIRKRKIKLYSRNRKENTMQYPELADIANDIDCDQAVLDGEIVVLDKKGKVNFQALQGRFSVSDAEEIKALQRTQKIVYNVFDLMYLDGYDLRKVSLLERKKLLKKILHSRPLLKYSPHVVAKGEALFRKAERQHHEGIMAKNASSFYEGHRSNEWLKIKTSMRQEVVIAGYTQPQGSRSYFGALHLGLYDGKKFYSVGHVGSGFDHDKLKKLYDLMQPLRIDHHPFDAKPEARRDVQWLKPKLVAEVRFSEWTKEGRLRQPVFEGLRNDKKPAQCQYERKHFVQEEVEQAERTQSKKSRTARSARSSATNTKGSLLKKLATRAKGSDTESSRTKSIRSKSSRVTSGPKKRAVKK